MLVWLLYAYLSNFRKFCEMFLLYSNMISFFLKWKSAFFNSVFYNFIFTIYIYLIFCQFTTIPGFVKPCLFILTDLLHTLILYFSLSPFSQHYIPPTSLTSKIMETNFHVITCNRKKYETLRNGWYL